MKLNEEVNKMKSLRKRIIDYIAKEEKGYWEIPGLAMDVVSDGVVLINGYGLRNAKENLLITRIL